MSESFPVSCTDPQFLTHVYFELLKSQQDHPLVKLFDLTHEARLSLYFDLSAIQDGLRFRALSRARLLSLSLVDGKGEIDRGFLETVISLFEKEGFLFYPTGTSDGQMSEHILRVLRALKDENVLQSLKRFQRPLTFKWAEKLVFETLGIHSSNTPTDGQIRAAVLCAALTPLRQNVGSCFATAPAILIQSDQLLVFLDDLYQLLSTGKLKRTFGGIEYAIPLSPSTGIGDLNKNLISGANAGFCPGLILALEMAGVLSSGIAFEEKGNAVQSLIVEFSSGKNIFTAQDLIHQVLLRKFQLSDEDLKKGRLLEKERFKMTARVAGRVEQLLAFREKEKECRSAFKGVCDNALLKSWEFTIASFSEVKMEFSRWNLYSSLGLSPQDPGGIGQLVYSRIDEKIAEINKKLEEYQKQYEIAFDQVRATESLLRNAASESDARRLQGEYQSRAYHMRACQEMRDSIYLKGSNYSKLLSFLTKQYDEKFPEYFQEIYDAEMQDFQGELYDDSPAGFRLVYKHGRSDPSLWTLIYDEDQYIDALLAFFSATESEIAAACDWEGGDDAIFEINSAIIAHIRTQVFLETALQRMAKAHASPALKSPLSNLQMIEKKPWAYTSGGTMTTLLKTYYRLERELTSEGKWVESESELLIFILDTLKNLPPRITDPYLKNLQRGMLMASPTHAFILLPAQEGFYQGWKEDIFTYTWVRDEIFLPGQKFYSEMRLTSDMQEFLLAMFRHKLPPLLGLHLGQGFRPKEKKVTVIEWRNHVLEIMLKYSKTGTTAPRQILSDTLDSFLYQNLPIVPGGEWKSIARRILSDLMSEKVDEVFDRFPDIPAPLLTAAEVREAAKGVYLIASQRISFSLDLHQFIAKHARFTGMAQPTPLLFADTNWTGNYFAFLVNPGTSRLELWRLDQSQSQGTQMSEWKQFVNGSDRKIWSIYTHPYEYEMSVRSPTALRIS